MYHKYNRKKMIFIFLLLFIIATGIQAMVYTPFPAFLSLSPEGHVGLDFPLNNHFSTLLSTGLSLPVGLYPFVYIPSLNIDILGEGRFYFGPGWKGIYASLSGKISIIVNPVIAYYALAGVDFVFSSQISLHGGYKWPLNENLSLELYGGAGVSLFSSIKSFNGWKTYLHFYPGVRFLYAK